MEESRFDSLARTCGRRLILGGVAGSALAALDGWPAEGKKQKKPSKRKRCRRRGREFCAGRCCPQGRRCEHGGCVASCPDPFSCGGGGGSSCAGDPDCFCTSTSAGDAACVDLPLGVLCSGFAPCASNGDCPSGDVCAICFCGGPTPDFRCVPPCG